MSIRTITPTRLPGLSAALSRGWERARERALRPVRAISLIFTIVTVAGLAAALQVLFGTPPDAIAHPALALFA